MASILFCFMVLFISLNVYEAHCSTEQCEMDIKNAFENPGLNEFDLNTTANTILKKIFILENKRSIISKYNNSASDSSMYSIEHILDNSPYNFDYFGKYLNYLRSEINIAPWTRVTDACLNYSGRLNAFDKSLKRQQYFNCIEVISVFKHKNIPLFHVQNMNTVISLMFYYFNTNDYEEELKEYNTQEKQYHTHYHFLAWYHNEVMDSCYVHQYVFTPKGFCSNTLFADQYANHKITSKPMKQESDTSMECD